MTVLADDDDWKGTFKAMEDALYERMRTEKEEEKKLTEETLTEFYKRSLKRYPAPAEGFDGRDQYTFSGTNPVYYTGGVPKRAYPAQPVDPPLTKGTVDNMLSAFKAQITDYVQVMVDRVLETLKEREETIKDLQDQIDELTEEL